MNVNRAILLLTMTIAAAGCVVAPALGASTDAAAGPVASNNCVWRIGDSMVASSLFQRQLLQRMPGWSDVNDGLGSQTSSEIAGRIGARKVTISVDGDALPAAGRPVPVTAIDPPILTSVAPTNSLRGRIGSADVKLVWNRESYSMLSLVPIDQDAPIMIPASSEFHPFPRPGRENCTALIWMGRNNMGQTDTILGDIAAVVAVARTGRQPFLIVSVTNGGAEGTGTTGYASAVRLNAALARIYGPHFVDVRARLLAAEPANDGTVPKSLRGDRIHLNEVGNAIAAAAVADALLAGKAR